jgi:IMP dehydrogenase
MKFADDKEYLTYDDVLMLPQRSDIESRKMIDLTSGRLGLRSPFISANMDTITEENMVIAMHNAGGSAIIHRFLDARRLDQIIKRVKSNGALPIISVGVNRDSDDLIACALENRVFSFCVDVAHGHHNAVAARIAELRERIPRTTHQKPIIIAGNVATPEGVNFLAEAGANIIKVGIGPGSHCTTRVVTGHGVPQLSAVANCVEAANHINRSAEHFRDDPIEIIADGGIRNSGDITKALAVGAKYVMLGRLLAGTNEAPGDVVVDTNTGNKVKLYRGMASFSAQRSIGKKRAPEGVASTVPAIGSVASVIEELADGVRSGLSYTAARNLRELREKAVFVRVTGAGHTEGTPHGAR